MSFLERSPSKREIAIGIREAEQRYHVRLRRYQHFEENTLYWGVNNAPLVGDSGQSYDMTFRSLLDSENLQEHIERVLHPKAGKAKALELGGVGSTPLVRGFTEGFFAQTGAVNLTDYRNRWTPDPTQDDEARNHRVFPGDVLSSEVQNDVSLWLGGKVDLIIERMEGGLATLPDYAPLLAHRIDPWYQMLAENGLLFAQLPKELQAYMPQWKDHVKKHYKGRLDIRTERNNSIIRIQKKRGAPEKLPLVPVLLR